MSAVTALATLPEVATAEYAPPKLSMAAARLAASSKAASFNARSAAVDTVAFDGCRRRSRERVVCSFTARGMSASRATTCSLRVAVRGQGSNAQARAPKAHCQSRSPLHLSYAAAKDAFFEYGRENGFGVGGIIIRKDELPRELKRLSATAFSARIEAIDQVKGEVCGISLVAKRISAGEVRVSRIGDRVCSKLRPLSDGEAMQAFEEYAARRGACGKGIHDVTRASATRVRAEVDITCDSQRICTEWIAAERSPSGGVSVAIASDVIGCRPTEG